MNIINFLFLKQNIVIKPIVSKLNLSFLGFKIIININFKKIINL